MLLEFCRCIECRVPGDPDHDADELMSRIEEMRERVDAYNNCQCPLTGPGLTNLGKLLNLIVEELEERGGRKLESTTIGGTREISLK